MYIENDKCLVWRTVLVFIHYFVPDALYKFNSLFFAISRAMNVMSVFTNCFSVCPDIIFNCFPLAQLWACLWTRCHVVRHVIYILEFLIIQCVKYIR